MGVSWVERENVCGTRRGREADRGGGRMPQRGLVGSRAVVERNYAILPPQGIPASVLPEWGATEAEVKGEPFMGVAELLLKTLLPADPVFDMAMNLFRFPPGYSLPVTETHFMEHGLYLLEGQGVYYLGDRWYEVEAGDFIWMGPY